MASGLCRRTPVSMAQVEEALQAALTGTGRELADLESTANKVRLFLINAVEPNMRYLKGEQLVSLLWDVSKALSVRIELLDRCTFAGISPTELSRRVGDTPYLHERNTDPTTNAMMRRWFAAEVHLSCHCSDDATEALIKQSVDEQPDNPFNIYKNKSLNDCMDTIDRLKAVASLKGKCIIL